MKRVVSRCLFAVAVIMALCGCLSQAYARLPMSQFGKNWVRTHPFQIFTNSVYEGGTQANGTNIDHLVDLGMTGFHCAFEDDLLEARSRGIIKHTSPWYPHPLLDAYGNVHPGVIARANAVSEPDDDDAWYILDEPAPGDVDACQIVKEWLAENRPDGLAYVNVTTNETLGANIDTLISTVQPDALGTDIYPFCGVVSYEVTNDYFEAIMKIRQKCLQNSIPYFCWAQSFGYSWAPWWPSEYRIASESEMKFNVYSLLLLGYKGITYYDYNGSSLATRDGDNYSGVVRWMVDDQGNPTTFYTNARTINAEIKKFCKYLRFLESTGVFFIPNAGHGVSPYYDNYDAVPLWSTGGDGDPYIQNIWLGTPSENKRDGLIGFFEDDDEQRYFMIQNTWRDYNATSADRYSGITIEFDGPNLPTPGCIYSLDPNTGRPVQVALTSGRYLYTAFGGGAGYLYSYEPFMLAGKDTVSPNGSIIINGGADTTASVSVTLTVSASDDSEVDQMRFSSNGTDWSSWETYNTSKAWTLTSGNGVKTVYAQFKDEAGNTSATCNDTITLFADPCTQVPLNILWRCVNGTDRFSTTVGSERASYTCDGQVFYIPKDSASGTQGLYRIFRASPYDKSDWYATSTGDYVYDTTQGYPWSTQVTGTDLLRYMVNAGLYDGATLHPYESLSGYVLYNSLGYGYRRYNTTAISNTVQSAVSDQSVSSNVVGGGGVSAWTVGAFSNKDVVNYYSYSRGVSSLLSWSGRAAYEAGDYNTARPDITLGTTLHGSPCSELVNYNGTSVWGNTRQCQKSWSIPLEGYPFNHGGGADNPVIYSDLKLGKDITLAYNGLQGVSRYVTRVSAPGTISSTTLSMPDGFFLGEYCNYYTFDAKNDTTTGPIALSYGGSSEYVPSTGYGGIICANGTGDSSQAIGIFGITEGQGGSITGLKIYNYVIGSTHTKYNESTTWLRAYRTGNISSGESTYTAWLVFGTLSDVKTYMRRLVPPTGSIMINNGDATTVSTSVTLNLSAAANYGSVAKMMISNNLDFSGAVWENYSTSKAWTLTSGAGTKTVYVKFLDNNGTNGDGNVSSVYQDSIQLL